MIPPWLVGLLMDRRRSDQNLVFHLLECRRCALPFKWWLLRNESAAGVSDSSADYRQERFRFQYLLRRNFENVLRENSQVGELSRFQGALIFLSEQGLDMSN